MNKKAVSSVLGRLLMIYSVSLIPPILISVFDAGSRNELYAFISTFLQSFLLGLILHSISHIGKKPDIPRVKEGFLIVLLYWVVIGMVGSLPFILSAELGPKISISDAIFESFSGLTTTGATVLTEIEHLSYALKYYRQQLQWIGGMGIIVLAVAVLPALGVGGMQLYKTEISGPFKTNKLTPRISEAARRLWYVYLILTLLCFLGYWLMGMNFFDAIAHSFSTIAIGGFSTYDANIGHFDSLSIEIVATIFMILSGINFALHYSIFHRSKKLNLSNYYKEIECRLYFIFLFFVCLITVFILYSQEYYTTAEELFRYGIFQTVSIATTTGFSNNNWSLWPIGLPMLLIFCSFIGGCSGSTAGGMKIIRFIMIFKQGMREVFYLIHPNTVRSLVINQRVVNERTISSVWGFFIVYLVTFCVLLLLLSLTGLKPLTAFSALAACLNNLGPGLEDVANNYQSLHDSSKIILSLAMLIGRLEFYTLLVILSPPFWRT